LQQGVKKWFKIDDFWTDGKLELDEEKLYDNVEMSDIKSSK
jgi:hypothetical protein